VWRALAGGVFEVRDCAVTDRSIAREVRNRAKRPDTASPTVLDAAPAVPPPARAATVAHSAGDPLGIDEKAKTHPGQFVQLAVHHRFPDDRDQQARHVVGAVALLTSRFGMIGVL